MRSPPADPAGTLDSRAFAEKAFARLEDPGSKNNTFLPGLAVKAPRVRKDGGPVRSGIVEMILRRHVRGVSTASTYRR